MIKAISALVGHHNREFSEKEFLTFLADNISQKRREQIVSSAWELQLTKTLTAADLIAPLDLRRFPENENSDDLLWVLREDFMGVRPDNCFDEYQSVYLASLYLHYPRTYFYGIEDFDAAIVLALDAVFSLDADPETLDRFKGFLFSLLKPVTDWQQLDGRSHFSLIAILLTLLWQGQHEASEFHFLLEYLLYHHAINPNFISENAGILWVDDWKSIAERVLLNAEDYREVVFALLFHDGDEAYLW